MGFSGGCRVPVSGVAQQRLRGAGMISLRACALLALAMVLAATTASCQPAGDEPPAPVRMVQTITVEPAPKMADSTFTGHVEAQDQAVLSFRIAGRLSERSVRVGASVSEGDTLARLDPEDELNELRSARAVLAAALSDSRKAENQFERLRHLQERNVATRADLEAAEQALTAARAQADAAQARVRSAEDFVGFTTLKADAPGIVTRVGAEPGEVVPAGRMIVQLARREGRDAVFEIPDDLIRRIGPDVEVRVALAGDPSVFTSGRVREIAPQADPVTRTFRIRVGLSDPPPSFRLGTAVTGTIRGSDATAVALPAAALTRSEVGTGVWLVDPGTLTVSLRKVDVLRDDPATALIGHGLAAGDIVVTAGTSLLRDGQQIRLAGTEAP